MRQAKNFKNVKIFVFPGIIMNKAFGLLNLAIV